MEKKQNQSALLTRLEAEVLVQALVDGSVMSNSDDLISPTKNEVDSLVCLEMTLKEDAQLEIMKSNEATDTHKITKAVGHKKDSAVSLANSPTTSRSGSFIEADSPALIHSTTFNAWKSSKLPASVTAGCGKTYNIKVVAAPDPVPVVATVKKDAAPAANEKSKRRNSTKQRFNSRGEL